MPEAIEEPVLRPKFKLTRDEIAKVIADATGQKPKPGFHSVTLVMQMDGESGMLQWVDAANRTNLVTPKVQQSTPEKPKTKGPNGNDNTNG